MDMTLFSNLALGFGVALTPINLMYCLVGVILGTLIGVLPGIGPVATIAMLLPVTFSLSPITALIMLAGIYYGAQYGGSTSAILVNLPGESSSVVTCLDGYQMARQGRAEVTLAQAFGLPAPACCSLDAAAVQPQRVAFGQRMGWPRLALFIEDGDQWSSVEWWPESGVERGKPARADAAMIVDFTPGECLPASAAFARSVFQPGRFR